MLSSSQPAAAIRAHFPQRRQSKPPAAGSPRSRLVRGVRGGRAAWPRRPPSSRRGLRGPAFSVPKTARGASGRPCSRGARKRPGHRRRPSVGLILADGGDDRRRPGRNEDARLASSTSETKCCGAPRRPASDSPRTRSSGSWNEPFGRRGRPAPRSPQPGSGFPARSIARPGLPSTPSTSTSPVFRFATS